MVISNNYWSSPSISQCFVFDKLSKTPKSKLATTTLATTSTAMDDDSPLLRVLTSATLFRRITACMTGWPMLVHQFIWPRVGPCTAFAAQKPLRLAYCPNLGLFIAVAIADNDVDMLERLHRLRQSSMHYREHAMLQLDDIAACAVVYQRLEILAWVRDTMPQDPDLSWGDRNLLDIAIAAMLRRQTSQLQDFCVLDWLDAHCPRANAQIGLQTLTAIIVAGRLDIIQWLHAHNDAAQFTPGIMDIAAAKGRLDIVQFLHEHRDEGCTTMAMDLAASNGHFAVLQFLHEHRTEGCTMRAMDDCVRVGNLQIAAYLHEHRREGCSLYAMTVAAGRGNLESVEFLHRIHPEPFSTDALDEAAAYGHLHIVKFLHEHRSDGCTRAAIDAAARRGYHHVVEYLCRNRTEGCSPTTLADVAARGFANTVRVLCEYSHQGCLIAARKRALRRNFTEVLDVLDEFIAPDVSDCNASLHDEQTPRRCQRQVRG